MMLAVMTVPLIGAIGVGIDFAEASRARWHLQNAADAAATASVSLSSPAFRAAGQTLTTEKMAAIRKDALNIFNANLMERYPIDDVEVTATVSRTGTQITSLIDFRAKIPTWFMGVLGRRSVDVTGRATASVRTAPFMDFFLVLDNSPSMGVGATPKDVATMVSNTPDQCAFACHDLSDSENYYKLAKSLKVTTRIEVVRQATEKLFETAAETRQHDNQFRMALYTFGESATAMGLTELSKLTADMKKAKKSAEKVDLMKVPHNNYNSNQLTDFDGSLAALNDEITNPGDGATTATPQKIVFFVSDGVNDAEKPVTCTEKLTGSRCQEPIDIAACEALKKRGIKVAVLYTTYLPLPTNSWYNTWIKPFAKEIGPRMKACATEGLFFEVSPTEGISEAMDALFQKVVLNPRITS